MSSRHFLVGFVLCVSLAVGQEALALPVGLAPGFQIAGTSPYLEVDLLGSPLSGQAAPPRVDGPLLLGISLWTAALLLLRAQGRGLVGTQPRQVGQESKPGGFLRRED